MSTGTKSFSEPPVMGSVIAIPPQQGHVRSTEAIVLKGMAKFERLPKIAVILRWYCHTVIPC